MELQTPELVDIVQEAKGWVKKYKLTYKMPDGTLHNYESASRKSLEDYRTELETNAKACAAILANDESQGPVPENSAVDAVSIVGITPRDTLVMIREFRYPINSWCVAFPAGLMEPSEDFATTADREMREETGYGVIAGTTVEPLPQAGFSSTGMTDEAVQVLFAHVDKVEEAHTEGAELINVFELPIADVPRFLNENRLPLGTREQLALERFAHR